MSRNRMRTPDVEAGEESREHLAVGTGTIPTNSGAATNSNEVGYNPFASPPDIKKAIKHAKARSVGYINPKDPDLEYCEDCGLPSKVEQHPLCGSRLDLADLGPGFPLYFEYVFFCGILLTGLFAIVGVYSLIANGKGVTCEAFSNSIDKFKCVGGFIIKYSLGNRSYNFPGDMDEQDDNATKVINILNIIYVVLGLLASFYYRRVQSMTADEVNRGAITNSDYTVVVKDLPETETADSIKKFFEENGRAKAKSVVKKVVLAYEIGPYIEEVRKKNLLESKKLKLGKEIDSTDLDTQIKECQDKIDQFENAVANNSSQKFTGIAFVTFETEKETIGSIKKFSMTHLERAFWYVFGGCLACFGIKFDKTYNGKWITLNKAPEPLDVFWENLGYSWWEVTKKRIFTLFSSVVLVAISFGMILGVSLLQGKISKNGGNSVAITLLSVLSSFLITMINGFIGFFMRKLAGYEKQTTYTYYFVSVATKLSLAQFSNTALITFLVTLIVSKDDGGIHLWVKDSLANKVFFLFVLNAIMPSLNYYLNPFHLIRMYNRNKIISDGANSKVTQQQANLTFEGPPYDIAQRYANVQKTMLFTGFYANLLPIGVPISVAALFITYWTDKYILLRRHARPTTLGKELAEDMADFLELFFVSLSAGNIIWEKIARDDVSLINWICLIIAFALYVLPNGFMASCIMKNDENVYNVKKYDEVRHYFLTEYDRVNPVTQEDATREWLLEMSKLHNTQISDANGNSNRTENKVDLAAYFQQLPKGTTIGNLANYANSKPSFEQVNSMNMGNNFMHHLPPQQMQAPMMNPGFNPGYPGQAPFMQQGMFGRFNSSSGPHNPFAGHIPSQPMQNMPMFRPPVYGQVPQQSSPAMYQPQMMQQPPIRQMQPQPQMMQPQPQMMQPQPQMMQQPPIRQMQPQPQMIQPQPQMIMQPQQPQMIMQQQQPMMMQPQQPIMMQQQPRMMPQQPMMQQQPAPMMMQQQPAPMMMQQQQPTYQKSPMMQQPQYGQNQGYQQPPPQQNNTGNRFDQMFRNAEKQMNKAFGGF